MPARTLPARTLRVIDELVPILLPAFPQLSADARRTVRDDVTAFVTAQVAALPSFLRLPYVAALTVFDLAPVLRFGRRFPGLDAERRARWLALWSDGPLAPTRNVVKLMRSCALLAYFDHDLVRAVLDESRRSGVRLDIERAAAS